MLFIKFILQPNRRTRMKPESKIMVAEVNNKLRIDKETLDIILKSIEDSKKYRNVSWFKHKIDLPFIKTTNTFILTKYVYPLDEDKLAYFKSLDKDSDEFKELDEEYKHWLIENSASVAYHLADWDLFDVPEQSGAEHTPIFNNVTAFDWFTKELFAHYEESLINNIELPEL